MARGCGWLLSGVWGDTRLWGGRVVVRVDSNVRVRVRDVLQGRSGCATVLGRLVGDGLSAS